MLSSSCCEIPNKFHTLRNDVFNILQYVWCRIAELSMNDNLKYTAMEAWNFFHFSPHRHAWSSLVSFLVQVTVHWICFAIAVQIRYFNIILCSKKLYFISAPRIIFYLFIFIFYFTDKNNGYFSWKSMHIFNNITLNSSHNDKLL